MHQSLEGHSGPEYFLWELSQGNPHFLHCLLPALLMAWHLPYNPPTPKPILTKKFNNMVYPSFWQHVEKDASRNGKA